MTFITSSFVHKNDVHSSDKFATMWQIYLTKTASASKLYVSNSNSCSTLQKKFLTPTNVKDARVCLFTAFYPHFKVNYLNIGQSVSFYGKYTLKVVGGGNTYKQMRKFSAEEIRLYNSFNQRFVFSFTGGDEFGQTRFLFQTL